MLNRQRLLEDMAEMQRPRLKALRTTGSSVAPQPGIMQGLPGLRELWRWRRWPGPSFGGEGIVNAESHYSGHLLGKALDA